MVNKQAVTSIITLKQRLKIYRSVKSFEMSPNKPHIWIYWDRLFTSVPTEPIFSYFGNKLQEFQISLHLSSPRRPSKNQMRWKNNKITDLEYGFRKLILGFGLTKMTQILVNWTFVTILKNIEYFITVFLQYEPD